LWKCQMEFLDYQKFLALGRSCFRSRGLSPEAARGTSARTDLAWRLRAVFRRLCDARRWPAGVPLELTGWARGPRSRAWSGARGRAGAGDSVLGDTLRAPLGGSS